MKLNSLLIALALLTSSSAMAIQVPYPGPNVSPKNEVPVQRASDESEGEEAGEDAEEMYALDNFDPESPDAEEFLKAYDEYYEQMTGESPDLDGFDDLYTPASSGCKRASCAVWIRVSIANQRAHLTVHGQPAGSWAVSTAANGRRTRKWDGHPQGPVKRVHESSIYPGGGFTYKGKFMGNMGFAVFYSGNFALHGTGSVKKLGRPASHGCVRQHPKNAEYFNQLVRQYGLRNTWVTVH